MSGQVVVALLNRTKESQVINFKLDSIGINNAKGYVTRDLWSKETPSTSFDGSITKKVPPHGAVVLKIIGESLPFNFFQQNDKK